jgi:uncharacterized membrane protein
MELISNIFHYICGQGRCFEIDGEVLPVCQRCFGLYAGAALTGMYLLLTRAWRRGLPNAAVVLLHSCLLIAALVGGLGVIDPGPMWRLLCGVWTGHVIMIWLIGASVHLYHLAHCRNPKIYAWRRRDQIEGLICAAVVSAFALSFTALDFLGWYFWTMVTTIGALFILGAVISVGVHVILLAILRKRPRLAASPRN